MLGVGLDFSGLMLDAARERFAGDERFELVEHDLTAPLPDLGRFDAVVSSMAIHHLEHERKRSLYAELFGLLEPGGMFANFEHVAAPSERLHAAFYAAIDEPLEHEDPSDRLRDVESQLAWLREARLRSTSTATGSGWRWRCSSGSSPLSARERRGATGQRARRPSSATARMRSTWPGSALGIVAIPPIIRTTSMSARRDAHRRSAARLEQRRAGDLDRVATLQEHLGALVHVGHELAGERLLRRGVVREAL